MNPLTLNAPLASITDMPTFTTILLFVAIFLVATALTYGTFTIFKTYEGTTKALEGAGYEDKGVSAVIIGMILTLTFLAMFFLMREGEDESNRKTLERVVAAQEKVLKDTGSYTDSIQVLKRVDSQINSGNLKVGLVEDEQEQFFEASIMNSSNQGYSVKGNSNRLFPECDGVAECQDGVWIVSLSADSNSGVGQVNPFIITP